MKTILILIVLLVAGPAQAATRIGLHVTQEELNVWRARMTDNVNTINGFTFQSVYQNRIKADADSFLAQSHPGGDGFWSGYNGPGCVPANNQSITPGSGGTPFVRGNGAWMMRSAFNFLLTGNNAYANPVRTELLSQITHSGTDFANGSKWCFDNLGGGNVLEIVPWINRLVISYDYLIAGGYTGFSAAEMTNISNWFYNAANLWVTSSRHGVQNSNYPGIFNIPQNLGCFGDCDTLAAQLYFNGPMARMATYFGFYNQGTPQMTLAMAVGLMRNDPNLIEFAVKYFTAYITAGTWDNGATSDFHRWADCPPISCPGSMWGHTASVTNSLTATADMYARAGNTSLYNLAVATQVLGGHGGTVSLLTQLGLLAKMANKTVLLHGTTNPNEVGPQSLLSWDTIPHPERHCSFPNCDAYWDFGSAVGNLYYRDADITTAMNRNAKSANNSSGCYDPQMAGCFSGIWAHWADLPFMFGNMENNAANPFLTVPLGLP